MNAMRYEVTLRRPSGMGSPSYDGKVTVFAHDYDDAVSKAKRKFVLDGCFGMSEFGRIIVERVEVTA